MTEIAVLIIIGCVVWVFAAVFMLIMQYGSGAQEWDIPHSEFWAIIVFMPLVAAARLLVGLYRVARRGFGMEPSRRN